MRNGQISLEIIMAIVVILLGLALVFASVSVRNSQKDTFEEVYENESKCAKIALAISNVYASGMRSRLVFEIDDSAFIGDSNVTIKKNNEVIAYCEFPAKAQPVQLSIGAVEAKNISGTVVLSNA